MTISQGMRRRGRNRNRRKRIIASRCSGDLSARGTVGRAGLADPRQAHPAGISVAVLAPTGCLTPDTLVTTDRGLVRLTRRGPAGASMFALVPER